MTKKIKDTYSEVWVDQVHAPTRRGCVVELNFRRKDEGGWFVHGLTEKDRYELIKQLINPPGFRGRMT